jgi:hypothetical protein
MGLSSQSHRWQVWTEANLAKIENLIRYDLGFDGYRAIIKRLTKAKRPCTEEFLWKLQIRTLGVA